MNDLATAVAVSGGVDSAVALHILSRAQRPLKAVHLRLYDSVEEATPNVLSAMCRRLNVPLHIVDLRERFQKEIVEPFVDEYLQGRTPNPCVLCNPRIKMGALMDWALESGVDKIATGHYARVEPIAASDTFALCRGRDRRKDQSYYLSRLSQPQLARFLTPLGNLTKDEVRAMARKFDIAIADREESQEVCFAPNGDYRRLLETRLAARKGASPPPGPIVETATGRVLGRHKGIHHYTVGQRRGLGISAAQPLYVVEIRATEGIVAVGPEEALYARRALLGNVVWTNTAPPTPVRARVQPRYRAASREALLSHTQGGWLVEFDAPQRALAPGQTAAIYDTSDERVLGAGFIERVDSAAESSAE